MIDLYLIRHAEAVPLGTPGYEVDSDRPLTEEGRGQAKRLGMQFQRREIRLDAIVTSPLVRARETTNGLLPELSDPKPIVEVLDEIGGQMRLKRVLRFLDRLDKPSVAIVGHQPMLGQFLARLIGSKKARVQIEKAGFAWLTLDALEKGGGILQWLIAPDWF